jgi:glycerol-3-phosphate acyltransferase PlsY
MRSAGKSPTTPPGLRFGFVWDMIRNMFWPDTFMAAALGYLLGSIPFGWLVAKAHRVDIQRVGSGNIGATNVGRTLGRVWGWLVFVLDAGKGWAAVALANRAWSSPLPGGCPLSLVAGLGAVVGHTWPVWLKFRGGKGVATGAGVVVGLAPWAAVVGAGTWLVALGVTRYVSVASICAALTVPLAAWGLYGAQDLWRPWALTAMGLLVVVRHRSNLQRLCAGTEPKIGRSHPSVAATDQGESVESQTTEHS